MSEEVLQRVEQLRKENLRLRAQCADKEFESGQLEKQLRRLERKIAAFDAPARSLAKGFLKSDTKDVAEANNASAFAPPPRPKLNASRTGYPSGIIIDGVTGEEVDPKSWQEPEALSANGLPALRLMHAMRSPPELNAEFDTERYAKLLGEGKQAEAEALIQAEGGPTLKQMQQEPLEVLRQCPELDVNWSDPAMHGCSLLQYACSMGYEDVTQELLQRRADASHQSHQGVSCLATALAHSWPSCAAQLLAARADANEKADPTGKQTLLMWASRIDYVDKDGRDVPSPLVSLLLTHRADVHAADARGKTPLMHAATHGSELAVQALVAARSDVDIQDEEGNTALQIALRCYHGHVASILLQSRASKKTLTSGQQSGMIIH